MDGLGAIIVALEFMLMSIRRHVIPKALAVEMQNFDFIQPFFLLCSLHSSFVYFLLSSQFLHPFKVKLLFTTFLIFLLEGPIFFNENTKVQKF